MSSPNETQARRCRPSRGARSRTFKCLKPEARPALSRIAGIKTLSGVTPNVQSDALIDGGMNSKLEMARQKLALVDFCRFDFFGF
jgi:hypothetical protein